MDYISDNNFNNVTAVDSQADDSSLLIIILDLVPEGWHNIREKVSILEIVKSLLVFLNAHLSLNNSNQAAFIGSSHLGSEFLYPNPLKNDDDMKEAGNNSINHDPSGLIDREMYRKFRLVDETVIEGFNSMMTKISEAAEVGASSKISGAISLALSYANRMQNLDSSISTTKASAMSLSTKMASGNTINGTPSTVNSAPVGFGSASSRILIVSPNHENNIDYISIMNTMFAAQKMRVPIDVASLASKDHSSYLQQASDATNGIYLHIENYKGIIQTLCVAFFVEPSIRSYIILPTNTNVNYRASCFITGKSVDLGYVCSVCLCIMSLIPESHKCPTCNSKFDSKIIDKLRLGTQLSIRKKRKLKNEGETNPSPPN